MELQDKIGKLTHPLLYRRAWRRMRRYFFPLPLGPITASIDQAKLRAIHERYCDCSAGYAKYANIDSWLRLNRERVQDLALHRSPPKRVLDLGCGGGFFLFLLQKLGHFGLGLDTARVPLYPELLELFGVQRVLWTIEPFTPLPDLKQKFDWITAFSVAFNIAGNRQPWNVAEWDFFLLDLQRHLAPGGKLFFGLNPSFAGDYYTPALRELFLARGAKVERERVFFSNGIVF